MVTVLTHCHGLRLMITSDTSYSDKIRMLIVRACQQTAHGGARNLETAFRQDRVEDIFSYARHNRVKDLERMLDQ